MKLSFDPADPFDELRHGEWRSGLSSAELAELRAEPIAEFERRNTRPPGWWRNGDDAADQLAELDEDEAEQPPAARVLSREERRRLKREAAGRAWA